MQKSLLRWEMGDLRSALQRAVLEGDMEARRVRKQDQREDQGSGQVSGAGAKAWSRTPAATDSGK